jgi:hypothetical protein
MMPEAAKKLFVTKYSSFGNEKFYKFLLNYAITRIISISEFKGASPEIELMDYHDKFLLLYRRENDSVYLDIAKLFRKAAHKIYRIMLKKDMIERNNKFLNLVS